MSALDPHPKVPSDEHARRMLEFAGFPPHIQVTRASGGFSSATVWRVEWPPATFALKAYLKGSLGLSQIHELLWTARERGIVAVPRVFRPWIDQTWIGGFGRNWDLVSWQPGSAVLSGQPTQTQLEAAGAILAQVHEAWRSQSESQAEATAVTRRVRSLDDWNAMRGSRIVSPRQAQIAEALEATAERARTLLADWRDRPIIAQPCLGDVWHGHLLYSGETVTGLIDHGSIRMDHPVVDLARLLGSLELTQHNRGILLSGYETHLRLSNADWDLLNVLEPTGIVGGLIHWFARMGDGQELTADVDARIEFLLRRAAGL